MSCTWLVAFCNIKDTIVDDLLPIPYKRPYIEMFEDIKSGIINGDFSAEQVAKFLEDAKMELYKDCKDCYLTPNNISDLQPVAYAVRKGSIKQARKRFFWAAQIQDPEFFYFVVKTRLCLCSVL